MKLFLLKVDKFMCYTTKKRKSVGIKKKLPIAKRFIRPWNDLFQINVALLKIWIY